jgi:hypothetical protein
MLWEWPLRAVRIRAYRCRACWYRDYLLPFHLQLRVRLVLSLPGRADADAMSPAELEAMLEARRGPQISRGAGNDPVAVDLYGNRSVQ